MLSACSLVLPLFHTTMILMPHMDLTFTRCCADSDLSAARDPHHRSGERSLNTFGNHGPRRTFPSHAGCATVDLEGERIHPAISHRSMAEAQRASKNRSAWTMEVPTDGRQAVAR